MTKMTASKFLTVAILSAIFAAPAFAQENILRLPDNYNANQPVVDNSINHGVVDNSAPTPQSTAQVANPNAGDSGIYKFVSGGIGEEGRDGFLAQNAGQGYTLRLTFTGPTGNYLALIDVSILDNKGTEVVRTQTDGPILLAALPAGTYTVKTDFTGEAKSQRVTVGKNGQKSLTIRFANGD